jgi:shikimate dehydrogenase
MNTYRFALLGHPVNKSLSPKMHGASFRALGIQAEYSLIDVLPAHLAERLDLCRKEGFNGLNVTLPHKTAALALMTRVDPIAQCAGAINVVRFDADGGCTGFNTDIIGFLTSLQEECGITPEGKRVLVFGSGGAGRAVALGCVRSGAAEIALADCDEAKAQQLAEDLLRVPGNRSRICITNPVNPVNPVKQIEADLIVHCTPAGLHAGDVSLLPPEAFRPEQVLYDVVYAQPVTPTMRIAQAVGARAVNGLGMLIHQGAAAFKIWTGLDADVEAMKNELRL